MGSTYIQLDKGYLTLPKDVDFPISLSVKDIKSGSGLGGYSQSITIDGSNDNANLLGYYFDVDIESESFDRNKKTECTVVKNGSEVFTGYIQLMKVIRTNRHQANNEKLIKYQINVFDEVSNLFIEVADKEVSELPVNELNHIFNRSNIIDSWENTEGYIYPVFAKSDLIYTLKDFNPAIFEKTIFDKIFQVNGYTYTWDSLSDKDIQFDKRILPFNGKEGDADTVSALRQLYKVVGEDDDISYISDYGTFHPIGWLPFYSFLNPTVLDSVATTNGTYLEMDSVFQDTQSQYNDTTDVFINKAGGNSLWTLNTRYEFSIDIKAQNGGVDAAFEVLFTSTQQARAEVVLTLVAQSTTDQSKVVLIDTQVIEEYVVGGTYSYSSGYQSYASGTNASIAELGLLDSNEEFKIFPFVACRYYNAQGQLIPSAVGLAGVDTTSPLVSVPLRFIDSSTNEDVKVFFDCDITNVRVESTPNIEQLQNGSIVDMQRFLPKSIKQKDILSSVQKSYNLIYSPDPDNEKNIIIKTRNKYYDDGETWDWTTKFDEKQPNEITFLSNRFSREQELKYKEGKDSINESYQNELNETFGELSIVLDNEYTKGKDTKELIYSATPSIQSANGQTLPSINGGNPEGNIRVLLANGLTTGFPFNFYDDVLPVGNPLLVGEYLHTSMYDNDVKPNFSLCFDSPKVLFHNKQTSNTNNFLYNLHHAREMTTINEGKVLTAYFRLNEVDFYKLSRRLDWNIYIEDNGYFYIDKIEKFNATKNTLTKVVLITADDKVKRRFKSSILPSPKGGKPITEHFNDVDFDTNIISATFGGTISGKYNVVLSKGAYVFGNQNIVRAESIIQGNNNIVLNSATGAKIIGNDLEVSESRVFNNGSPDPIITKLKVSQAGTSDPTYTTFADAIGVDTFERKGVGEYEIEFTRDIKGLVMVNFELGVPYFLTVEENLDNSLVFEVRDNTGTLTDGFLDGYLTVEYYG